MMTEKEQLIADAIKLGINYGADARDSIWSVVGVVSPGATSKVKTAADGLISRLETLIECEVRARLRVEREGHHLENARDRNNAKTTTQVCVMAVKEGLIK